jgi:hypothetical protein
MLSGTFATLKARSSSAIYPLPSDVSAASNSENGAKSTNPETGEDENEMTEAALSGKKEDETRRAPSDGWMLMN